MLKFTIIYSSVDEDISLKSSTSNNLSYMNMKIPSGFVLKGFL